MENNSITFSESWVRKHFEAATDALNRIAKAIEDGNQIALDMRGEARALVSIEDARLETEKMQYAIFKKIESDLSAPAPGPGPAVSIMTVFAQAKK